MKAKRCWICSFFKNSLMHTGDRTTFDSINTNNWFPFLLNSSIYFGMAKSCSAVTFFWFLYRGHACEPFISLVLLSQDSWLWIWTPSVFIEQQKQQVVVHAVLLMVFNASTSSSSSRWLTYTDSDGSEGQPLLYATAEYTLTEINKEQKVFN